MDKVLKFRPTKTSRAVRARPPPTSWEGGGAWQNAPFREWHLTRGVCVPGGRGDEATARCGDAGRARDFLGEEGGPLPHGRGRRRRSEEFGRAARASEG